MAEFTFNCPQCGQRIEADESSRGQVAECPHCGKGIVVPHINPKPQMSNMPRMETTRSDIATPKTAVDAHTVQIKCPHCGRTIEVSASLRGKMTKCPHCRGHVVVPCMETTTFTPVAPKSVPDEQTIRIRCRHCGQEIEVNQSFCGEVAECPHCGKGIGVPSKKSEPGYNPLLGVSALWAVRAAPVCATQKPKQEQKKVYVCTNCGEPTTSPKTTRLLNGFICASLCIFMGILFGFGGMMVFPLLGIAVGAGFLSLTGVCLFAGCIPVYYCKECKKYNTMISASSPQGIRLLKSKHHSDNCEAQVSSNGRTSPEDRLLKLLKLKEAGIVSEEEYKTKRQKILAEI